MFARISKAVIFAVVAYTVLYGVALLYSPRHIPFEFRNFVDFMARMGFLLVCLILVPYLAYTIAIRGKKLAGETEKQPAQNEYPEIPQFYQNDLESHGSADWTHPDEIYYRPDGRFLSDPVTPSLYIGGGNSRHYIHSLMHAITFAGSGQGKGVCMILPNLLTRPWCSWFILDPKGENAKITARFHQESGQKVIILDPWDEQTRLGATHGIKSSGFNPLDFIKGNQNEMPESCAVLADMLVPDQARVSDPFWNNRARALIKTYLLHLLTARPDEEHHLGTLYRWLRLPLLNRKRLWEEIQNNEAQDGIIQSSIGEFSGFGEDSKTLESIMATAQDSTTFLETAVLRQSLLKSDFDPYELTNGLTTVYVCLPERFLNTHSRWLRVVVGICLKACNYKPNERVNFLLDEFAILGKMKDVENAYAFARGQNVSMWVFVQSLTQLNDIYGENGANAFLANARLRQFFGVYDLATQKYLSEYLGETTRKLWVESSSQGSGTSQGKTEGMTSGSTYGVQHGSNSQGESSGTSHSSNRTSSSTTGEQYIQRRLLTPEEVGKTKEIITLIDDQKYLIPRIPYWSDINEAYKEGKHDYYPANEQDWKEFIDEIREERPKSKGINFSQLGRPDIPKMKAGQSFHI